VYNRTRSDGRLFNVARLKKHSKTREICIRELLCADDSALVATEQSALQEILNGFSVTANLFGLKINISKTELLHQPSLHLNHNHVKFLSMAKRWKSVSHSSIWQVQRIVQAKAFGALHKRLWSRHEIRRSTKVKVYNTAVLPAFLYSTECITLYRRHLRKLTRVQLRHLRYILGIRWQDKIPNVDVLARAKTVSVEALITASQHRWAGHMCRMPNNPLPKAVLYGKLSVGKRKTEGQK